MAKKQAKPKMSKRSWRAIVDKADPDRKKRRVIYEFSNGRKFYNKGE